jgi:hypothetical protein
MQIRYYVLRQGAAFGVSREGRARGLHPTQARALDSAIFMGTIEAAARRGAVEVFVEDARGHLLQACLIGPDGPVAAMAAGEAGDDPERVSARRGR